MSALLVATIAMGCDPMRDDSAAIVFEERLPTQHPAADVELVALEANQGVARRLAAPDREVAQADAPVLVSDRRTLVRTTLRTLPGFERREIIARLSLLYRSGEQLDLDQSLMLAAGEQQEVVDWELAPEVVEVGMHYRVRLLETQPRGDAVEHPPVLPADAPGDFGVTYTGQALRVVLVPFTHDVGTCSRTPPLDTATLDAYRSHLEMRFPVREVDVTVREPVSIVEPIEKLEPVLLRTREVRVLDRPAPDVFYVGIIDPCGDPTTPGGLGLRPKNAGSPREAERRVAVIRHYPKAPEFSYEKLIAHELGHNIGRGHVLCSGKEGAIDPDYPHDDGHIGVTGYGIHDDRLRSPTTPDYMTYCIDGDYWVSDYGWDHAATVLDALNGARALVRDEEPVPVLQVMLGADGSTSVQRTWSMRAIEPSLELTARMPSGVVQNLAAEELVVEDSATRLFLLPDDAQTVGTFEVVATHTP